MIYNREESDVQTLGDVEKFKVSIDEKNINHIVTILSSNLYSHPMTSFLRETVSNALDAHTEAGVTEPVIITRTPTDLSIRDFGTGISPERFQEIYLNIGSSTKRDSNDYIGHFGIGRFSCLSVSPIANITSFYNGKAYYYVMNKDIDQLHIDLLYEKDTTEHNGVEVKIPLKCFDSKNLRCLVFIKDIFYNDETDAENSNSFNTRNVAVYKHFKMFKCNAFDNNPTTEVLLGDIPYAVDYHTLWPADDKFHLSWANTFKKVYPTLEIGSVDITPNREGLIYSDRTLLTLRMAYAACINELTELWNQQCNNEYTDLVKYIDEVRQHEENALHLCNSDVDFYLTLSDELDYIVKYKNCPQWSQVKFKTLKSLFNRLYNSRIPTIARFEKYDNRLNTNYDSVMVSSILKGRGDTYDKLFVVPSRAGFTGKYLCSYLKQEYPKFGIIVLRDRLINYHNIRTFIAQYFGMEYYKEYKYRILILQMIREAIRTIQPFTVVDDIINSSDYAQFKKDNMPARKNVFTGKVHISIHATASGYYNSLEFKLSEIMPYIKSHYKNKRVVYAEACSPFIKAFRAIGYPNLVILAVSKSTIRYFEEGALPSWVEPIENLYSPDNKTLIRYVTINYISKQKDIWVEDRPFFPKEINRKIQAFRKYFLKYQVFDTDDGIMKSEAMKLFDIIPKEKYDPVIMALYYDVYKYLKFSHFYSSSIYRYFNSAGCNAILYLAVKEKKIRLDYNYFMKAKQFTENILNVL